MPKKPTEKDREKGIFDFTSLRVWQRIFPAVIDLEKYLSESIASEKEEKRLNELTEAVDEALNNLVKGYYQFKGKKKESFYTQARLATGRILYLIYHLGFLDVIEKKQVLELGEAFKDSIIMINSLIKSVKRKTNRNEEEWRLIKRK